VSVIIILITVSVLVAGGFLLAFLWSVKSGQMDDDYTPSVRMLFDDELVLPEMDVNLKKDSKKNNLVNQSISKE
jgi:cbb3-type cytochrome oxidase maturation protein